MTTAQKLGYWLRSALQQRQPRRCPCCGGAEVAEIDRKAVVTRLLQCQRCALNFRWPRDDSRWLQNFYQQAYSIDQPLMTELPSQDELARLKADNFSEHPDYSGYLNQLAGRGRRILDYGCSWGYNVYKLSRDGFCVEGFELSRPRADYGCRNLGVTIHTDSSQIQGCYDVIFSSHVIEHLPSIPDFLAFVRRHLSPDGHLIVFCPNGSNDYRQREPQVWHLNWGLVHPNFLGVDFVSRVLSDHPYLVLTGDWTFPLDAISGWDGQSQVIGERRDGKELMFLARPNILLS